MQEVQQKADGSILRRRGGHGTAQPRCHATLLVITVFCRGDSESLHPDAMSLLVDRGAAGPLFVSFNQDSR
jgi:hypothetical protein